MVNRPEVVFNSEDKIALDEAAYNGRQRRPSAVNLGNTAECSFAR